ncbi:MAG: hypothetical protein DME26_08665 [Verrucomicrobia bacterium]|nr:MAG: hypothetical protein DME26_08665 [Verrucomicrobiota bacterium]
MLKVTPAHDKNDFEIGQRHKLAVVDIINPNGSMNDLAGKDLAGLDRFVARKVAVEKLAALGSLVKEEPYENKIAFSQRARVPIEQRLSEQWFLKYPAVEQSKACVEQAGSAAVPVADSGVSPESSSSAGVPLGGTPTSAGGSPVPPRKMRFHPDRWAFRIGASAASFGGGIGFRCGEKSRKCVFCLPAAYRARRRKGSKRQAFPASKEKFLT